MKPETKILRGVMVLGLSLSSVLITEIETWTIKLIPPEQMFVGTLGLFLIVGSGLIASGIYDKHRKPIVEEEVIKQPTMIQGDFVVLSTERIYPTRLMPPRTDDK